MTFVLQLKLSAFKLQIPNTKLQRNNKCTSIKQKYVFSLKFIYLNLVWSLNFDV